MKHFLTLALVVTSLFAHSQKSNWDHTNSIHEKMRMRILTVPMSSMQTRRRKRHTSISLKIILQQR